MNKVRTHVSIPLNVNDEIKEYSEKNKVRFSEAISQLVSLGLNNVDLTKAIRRNNILVDKIYSKACYLTALIEQLYSDLEIDELSNTSKCDSLNKFKTKYNKYTIDD